MFANRYTALIDACSLVGVLGRNILLTLAEAEFFRLRWSDVILGEAEKALADLFAIRGIADAAQRARQSRLQMEAAFPEAMVTAFEEFMPLGADLPDPNDAHVLAAAVKTQAQVIVTENLKDFPPAVLAVRNLEARKIDDFIADTIALDEGRAIPAIRSMRERLRRPEKTPEALLRDCEAYGLIATADLLREFTGSI